MSRQRGTQTTQTNGQLVKGLRRRPLTAKTRVRFSYWLLETSKVIRKFFCCLNIFLPPGLCLLFLCKKTPQSDFFRQPCGVWIQTLEVRILILFTENLRKQVHRHQLLHFSILQSHITIQRLSLFFLIHFLTLPHPQPVLPG